MKRLPRGVISFFERQGYVVACTVDGNGAIHCAAKGIAAIEERGYVYLADLYMGRTFHNLAQNNNISLTAIDEKHFTGFSLKGTAEIVKKDKIRKAIFTRWDDRIAKRISKRLIKHVQNEEQASHNPEAHLPGPQYVLRMEVKEIVDLSPQAGANTPRDNASGAKPG